MIDKKEPGSALSALQRKACEEFIKDLRPTKALLRAGYAEQTADRNSGKFFDRMPFRKRPSVTTNSPPLSAPWN